MDQTQEAINKLLIDGVKPGDPRIRALDKELEMFSRSRKLMEGMRILKPTERKK